MTIENLDDEIKQINTVALKKDMDERSRNRISFHVSQNHAGLLGLGSKVQMKIGDKVVEEKTLYGESLTQVNRFYTALVWGRLEEADNLVEKLPKSFRNILMGSDGQ